MTEGLPTPSASTGGTWWRGSGPARWASTGKGKRRR